MSHISSSHLISSHHLIISSHHPCPRPVPDRRNLSISPWPAGCLAPAPSPPLTSLWERRLPCCLPGTSEKATRKPFSSNPNSCTTRRKSTAYAGHNSTWVRTAARRLRNLSEVHLSRREWTLRLPAGIRTLSQGPLSNKRSVGYRNSARPLPADFTYTTINTLHKEASVA
jgi:hypothetical protein